MALVFPGDCPGLILGYSDPDTEGFVGEKALDVLRPFHQAEASAVDVVIKADVKGFGVLGDAVEIEVED